MTLETLNNVEFQQIAEEDAREVLGGLAEGSHTTADGRCILDGQAVNDYKTDVDEPAYPYDWWLIA